VTGRPPDEDDGPAPLLVEEIVERPRRTVRRRRVTADARFFEYTDVEMRREDGRVAVARGQLAWRFRRKLGAEHMRAIFAGLEESGFFALEEEYGVGSGGTVVTWRATLLGSTHEVRLVGTPRVRVAAIEGLERVFNLAAGRRVTR
jgi:hypothetical protein